MRITLKHAVESVMLGCLGAASILVGIGRRLVDKGRHTLDRCQSDGDHADDLPVDPAALTQAQRAALRRQLEQMDGPQGNG